MTDVSNDSKAIYLRLLRRVLPHRRTFAFGIAAMIALGLTEPAIPAILEMVVSSFEQEALDGVPPPCGSLPRPCSSSAGCHPSSPF